MAGDDPVDEDALTGFAVDGKARPACAFSFSPSSIRIGISEGGSRELTQDGLGMA